MLDELGSLVFAGSTAENGKEQAVDAGFPRIARGGERVHQPSLLGDNELPNFAVVQIQMLVHPSLEISHAVVRLAEVLADVVECHSVKAFLVLLAALGVPLVVAGRDAPR